MRAARDIVKPIVVLVLITLFVVLNLVNSRSGRAIMAARDNRIAGQTFHHGGRGKRQSGADLLLR